MVRDFVSNLFMRNAEGDMNFSFGGYYAMALNAGKANEDASLHEIFQSACNKGHSTETACH